MYNASTDLNKFKVTGRGLDWDVRKFKVTTQVQGHRQGHIRTHQGHSQGHI